MHRQRDRRIRRAVQEQVGTIVDRTNNCLLPHAPVLEAVPSFAAMYKRAVKMQPLLAFFSFFGGVAAWFAGANGWWLISGIIMGSLFPYTMVMMLPLNKELTASGLDENSPRAAELLDRWGNLHKYRAIAGLVAFVIFLLLLRFA